jgi:phosphoribosyl 1,2-cyclic phosphodiesterase
VKICVLRSGSSGNCTIIEYQGSYILLDAGGMSQKRIKELLSEVNISLEHISGLIITHTHSDHINYSALKVCEKFKIPVYIHEDNLPIVKNSFGTTLISNLMVHTFNNDPFLIDKGIQISPFEISHDAAKVTSGFSLMKPSGSFFTYAADLGYFPDSLASSFINSKVIILESNHDLDLLWKNPSRPHIHKKRVAGNYGHLSNIQAAEAILKILDGSHTAPEKIVLCHLSKDHNSPELATETITKILEEKGIKIPLFVAKRGERTVFFEV